MLIGSFSVHSLESEIFLMQLVSCKISLGNIVHLCTIIIIVTVIISIMLQDCSLFLYSRIVSVNVNSEFPMLKVQ